jgi:hypothetical protein
LNTTELPEIWVSALFEIPSHSLYQRISCGRFADPNCFKVFQFVRFEYPSRECFSDFRSIICDFMDDHLREAISPRLPTPLSRKLSGKFLPGKFLVEILAR